MPVRRVLSIGLIGAMFGLIRATESRVVLDRVSVPSPIAFDILMDTMARDRVPMYLFSV